MAKGAPDLKRLIQGADGAARAPQEEQGTHDTPVAVGLVVLKIDGGCGTVVLAQPADRRGLHEAPLILRQRLGRVGVEAAGEGQDAPHEKEGIASDQALRQRLRLYEKEPAV